ncbi:hypothetical protein DNTS_007133 [Danionella cerebrum]|uniref:LRRCT domain-containing protein n=1 Tax=Danionella cerebrum TaxID=2873325 RepID=A0A553NAJ6_9TELE|nr:hypothetical protein DNTS_007133 [Danionella translucida]
MPMSGHQSVVHSHSEGPCLLLLLLVLSASGHPQSFPCRLIQNTAMCNSCHLSSIPDVFPPEIEEIFLDKNLLVDLQDGLSRYPFLKMLSCANNQLMIVQENVFSESRLLERLNLADNDLHFGHQQVARALSSLSQLKTLDLSGNGLREDMVSILVQNLSSLESLYLSRNAIQRLDESTFKNLHQLKELNIEKNVLFEISGAFDHMKKLQRLNLAFNCLPCLVNFEMTQLLVLNASHNSIDWFITNQELTETFMLETLDLSDNHLLFFPFLPTHNRIRTLLLANNRVGFYQHLSSNTSSNWTTSVEYYNLGQNVSNITMDLWNENLHGNLSSVELLDLNENRVNYFPQGFIKQMPHLYWLRLRSNCLQSFVLTSEELPISLYELDVSRNRLKEIKATQHSVSELNNLTHLNLSKNDLHKLSPRIFTSLPNLNTLDLSYNTVDVCYLPNYLSSSECLQWYNMTSLKQLYLAGCSIRNMPWSAFKGTALTHLELSDNPNLQLQQKTLEGLENSLQHLGLGNTDLHAFDFSLFTHLMSLNIRRNSLADLPESLMALKLKILDVRDNLLTTIRSQHASMLAESLQTVYMNGNAFNCCQLDWYMNLRESKVVNVADLSEITCLDLNHRRHRFLLLDAVYCGDTNIEESVVWYILLFLTVSVSIMGIFVIYMLTFQPRLLPRVIKKRCWRQTPY